MDFSEKDELSTNEFSFAVVTDYELALALTREQEYNPVGVTENAVFPDHKNKENYQPRTLIDQTLEYIDPTPNIYTLFMQFNTKFFWNKLLSVEVKWSPRMTTCAGICTFHPRNRSCVISLSAPLLKLRPRKDLVETLLHEMIHAYLFLTNNNRDRDGHGPEFQKHSGRINREAGTDITIYHDFHEEVKLYQQHWWRCNGPCQRQPPYFGTVRRSMNRAPGPNDSWWARHRQMCNGEFIKVREPEPKAKSRKSDGKKNSSGTNVKGGVNNKIDDYFKKPWEKPKPAVTAVNGSLIPKNGTYTDQPPKLPDFTSYVKVPVNDKIGTNDNFKKPSEKPKPAVTAVNGSLVPKAKPTPNGTHSAQPPKMPVHGSLVPKTKPTTNGTHSAQPSRNPAFGKSNQVSTIGSSGKSAPPAGLVKLGTATNKVHGWGTGGPGSSSGTSAKSPRVPSNKVSQIKPPRPLSFTGTVGGVGTGRSNLLDKYSSPTSQTAPPKRILKKSATIILDTPSPKKPKIETTATAGSMKKLNLDDSDIEELYDCPICNLALPLSSLNDHLDNCVSDGSEETKNKKFPGDKNTDSKKEPVVILSPEKSGAAGVSRKGPKTLTPIKGQTDLNAFVVSPKATASKHFPCPVCGKPIEENLLNEHLDKCLANPKENGKTENPKSVLRIEGPQAGPSVAIESNDVVDVNDISGTGEPYVCLVCNAKIRGDIALNDHLDECVQTVFNDDSPDPENDGSFSIPSTPSVVIEENKFPCPICMKLIVEKMMNQHLDTCLSGQDWE